MLHNLSLINQHCFFYDFGSSKEFMGRAKNHSDKNKTTRVTVLQVLQYIRLRGQTATSGCLPWWSIVIPHNTLLHPEPLEVRAHTATQFSLHETTLIITWRNRMWSFGFYLAPPVIGCIHSKLDTCLSFDCIDTGSICPSLLVLGAVWESITKTLET